MDRLMQIKAQTAPTSIQPAALPGIPSTEQGHPPMTIRGVTGPDTTMTPLTPSQQAAKSIQALIAQEPVKHEVAKKFGPSQFHTVPEEGLGVITDAAGNVIQTFQGGHGKEEREQRQIEAANARAELAGRSRIAAAKIAAGGRATDEDREFTHFNAMLGQLDHLVRAKAFAQNKTDIFSIPGVSQPLSDADAQTAVATLDQQIQEKRNFLQNQFPDLWKKYGVAVPAPSSDGSLMMPSHGPTPAASTGTPSITPAEAIQELKRRGRI